MIVKIDLPEEVNILIKKGDRVNFQTPLYEKKAEKIEKIAVAQAISVPTNKIFDYLTKFVGEKVKKGEPLAIKKTFFTEKKCLAEQTGIIKEINHQEGIVLIKTLTTKKKNVFCFFKGTVERIGDKSFELDINNGLSFKLRETNQDFGGQPLYLKEGTKETQTLSEEESKNKVIITHKLDNYSLAKLSTLNVKGYVLENKKNISSDFNYGLIKKLDDLEKIFAYNRKYCLILKNRKELIIYE